MNKTTESIVESATLSLIATVIPEDATNKEIEWTSSDESVATVDKNGKITAIAEGNVTITATAKDGSNVKAECSIEVKMVPTNYIWTQSKTEVTEPYTDGLYDGVYYHPDGRTIGVGASTDVSSIVETCTFYQYYPYSLTTSNAITGTCKGISTSSKAYEMIFGIYANTSAGIGNQYWIASLGVYTSYSNSNFCILKIDSDGAVSWNYMWRSHLTTEYDGDLAVRAVISL